MSVSELGRKHQYDEPSFRTNTPFQETASFLSSPERYIQDGAKREKLVFETVHQELVNLSRDLKVCHGHFRLYFT